MKHKNVTIMMTAVINYALVFGRMDVFNHC